MTPGEDLRISLGLGGICLRLASTYPVEAVDWLWPGWLARGKVHILAGAPGTGKTSIAMALAATITVGGRWPDGGTAGDGDILVWSGEDDPSDTLVPRLLAVGADLRRVHVIHGALDEGADRSRPFDPASDMPMLAEEIALMDSAPALLIIDPVVSAVAGDSHKNGEVRRALQPLVDLAMTRKIAVLGITHFSKGTAGRDPVERVTGSLAFGALARIVMVTAKLPDEQGGGRILARGKSNIGKDDGGFGYDLEVMEVRPGIETTCVIWGEAITGSAREILGQAEAIDDPVERAAWEEARDWLLEELADGPRKASDVQRSAKASGITEKSLRTARERLGIKPSKEAFSAHGFWMWKLPHPKMPSDREDAQDAHQNCSGDGHLTGHLAPNDGHLAPNLPIRCPAPQSLSEGILGILGNEGILVAEPDALIRVTI